ncbi:MAG TPA: glycerol-3-phosphate acyltransferase, partial [Aquifex sp.]|nr:glycerol-3-phosphate acyltransferase [Aquifex sp.]
MEGILIISAFLLGSIPFGYLIALFKGIDIRKYGSGNVGATNVARVLGKSYGIAVYVLDFL